MPIRANLRALMEHHRVSQYALAKAAGVPQPTIQRILSGESEDPKTATVGRLARVFGVTVEDLRGTAEGLRIGAGPVSEESLELARAWAMLPKARREPIRQVVFMLAFLFRVRPAVFTAMEKDPSP